MSYLRSLRFGRMMIILTALTLGTALLLGGAFFAHSTLVAQDTLLSAPQPSGMAIQETSAVNAFSCTTLCQEVDNISLAMFGNLGDAVTERNKTAIEARHFRINATHPAYVVKDYSCTENFENCLASDLLQLKSSSRFTCNAPIFTNGIYTITVCDEPEWWRPTPMTVNVGENSQVGDFITIAKNVDPGGTNHSPQFFVLYQDSYIRMKPLSRDGVSDNCFGTSVIVGPMQDVATRPYADIKEITINPETLCIDITYLNEETATLCMKPRFKQLIVEVNVGYSTAAFDALAPLQPFALMRTMYVSPRKSDGARLQTDSRDFSILDWSMANSTSWKIYRQKRSHHNQSAPDIKLQVASP